MSLYVWGTNTSRQLINQVSTIVSAPTQAVDKLIENQIPLQVACGYDHSMVLTESGDVYYYGSGKHNAGSRGSGIKVQGLDHETIVHIAAGAHSSYAVSNTGKVYHW
jgi:alpha-tubulin suppressor-like RCC1 family protein